MLLVLFSLVRSGVAGVREWLIANALAVVSLPLFAARAVIPAFLSIEVANALLMGVSSMMLAGFRRHVSRPVPAKALMVCGATVLAVLAVLHYGYDSIALRIAVVSAFHSAVCLAMGLTVYQALNTSHSRYAHLFTVSAALLLALGYAFRSIIYAVNADVSMTFFHPSVLDIFFLLLGTLALPGLTLGAVMMANGVLVAKAEHAANRDFLTGAWSRRAFFEIAERERARAVRMGQQLSLLVFDVDHFKQINDMYGHPVGDQVLVDIVLRAETVIRNVDYCARLGGEEFAVLLLEVDAEAAAVIAERLRAVLERAAPANAASPGATPAAAYSVSIGVAALNAGESISDLIRRADNALYVAKARGRNTVVCAGPENNA
ncbi:MAG: diguanylate cyclase [Noviherbaspirillum sp.]